MVGQQRGELNIGSFLVSIKPLNLCVIHLIWMESAPSLGFLVQLQSHSTSENPPSPPPSPAPFIFPPQGSQHLFVGLFDGEVEIEEHGET